MRKQNFADQKGRVNPGCTVLFEPAKDCVQSSWQTVTSAGYCGMHEFATLPALWETQAQRAAMCGLQQTAKGQLFLD